MQKYLPTNDLLFKKCLTSKDSAHILKAFVKDLLNLEFKTLQPKETYHIDSYKKDYEERIKMEIKRTEVDILAIAEDDSHTTIECQIQPHDYFQERTLFYLAEAYRSPFGNVIKEAEAKKNNYSSLRPAYGINIVDFHLFDEKEKALQLFHLLNEETCQPFLNQAGKELWILCFLSLKNKNIERQQAVYHWQYFFQTGEVQPDSPDYIKEAKIKTDFLNLEEEERDMVENIEKARDISNAELATAERKGRKEGHREGRAEEKHEIALKMLRDKFRPQKVSEFTGLSISEIEKLKTKKE